MIVEIGAFLAVIGWSIDAFRRADERLDAAEGKISNLLIEVQRLRAYAEMLDRRTGNKRRSEVEI